MKQEKSCGAIVIREEGKHLEVLVIRQNQGHWCFPKGHVENDESEYETAFREIREETGIEVEFLDGFRETTNYSPKDGVQKEVVYFLAKPKGGKEKVQKEEVSEICWMRLIDAFAIITYDNDAALLRKAVRYIKDHLYEDEWL